MIEIGGFLGLDNFLSYPYYDDLIKLNTARNALLYLCKSKGIKKVYIPYYLCDSVSIALEREKIEFEYYHINENFSPVFDSKIEEDAYIYFVNYFGQLREKDINYCKNKYHRIILDNSQAFFTRPLPHIDTIYSCRKFFGVSDGAYLSTDAKQIENLERDYSKNRLKHILGRYEDNDASAYYLDFKKNDDIFYDIPIKKMSAITENFMGCIDYKKVKGIREDNWEKIELAFGNKNKFKLFKPDGPYMYPLYCKDGKKAKEQLAKRKIYIPTLWPSVLKICKNSSIEYDLAKNVLPIPIDQRYNADDMKLLISAINEIVEI